MDAEVFGMDDEDGPSSVKWGPFATDESALTFTLVLKQYLSW